MKCIISLGPRVQKGEDSFARLGVMFFVSYEDEQAFHTTLEGLSKEMRCDLFVVEGKIFSAKEIAYTEEEK